MDVLLEEEKKPVKVEKKGKDYLPVDYLNVILECLNSPGAILFFLLLTTDGKGEKADEFH